jgi:hypothetical protein
VADTDIVFAFDVRIDRPVCPIDMPASRRERFAAAVMESLERVFSEATSRGARAVVLFGELLAPGRVSPSQAADIAEKIEAFVTGRRLVVVATPDAETSDAVATVLGKPAGLQLLSPERPVLIPEDSWTVELSCGNPRELLITTRRVIAAAPSDGSDTAPASPPCVITQAVVRGRRDHADPPFSDPPAAAVAQTLCPLQPRNHYEYGPGSASCLRISQEGRLDGWNVFPTATVTWLQVHTVCSPHEPEEELSATAAVEVEKAVAASPTPLTLVRLFVDCDSNADQRGRVARMAPAVLAEMRQLLETTPAASSSLTAWCDQVLPNPEESLQPIADTNEIGGRKRFSAMLASAAADWPLDSTGDERIAPAVAVSDAAWMALELLEDD